MDSRNMDPEESDLIRNFIHTNYYTDSSSSMNRFCIESMLTNFYSTDKIKVDIRNKQIQMFMEQGIFEVPKKTPSLGKSAQTRIPTPASASASSKGRFHGLDMDDDDEEDEDDEDDEVNDKKSDSKESFGDLEDFGDFGDLGEFEEFPEADERVLKNIKLYLKYTNSDDGLEDLIYFIESNKIQVESFTYGLFCSLSELIVDKAPMITSLYDKLTSISGYENFHGEFVEVYRKYPKMIESMGVDNPKISNIVGMLF